MGEVIVKLGIMVAAATFGMMAATEASALCATFQCNSSRPCAFQVQYRGGGYVNFTVAPRGRRTVNEIRNGDTFCDFGPNGCRVRPVRGIRGCGY